MGTVTLAVLLCVICMSHLHACLYVPDFPAAVRLRGERNLCAPPTVVFTGKAPNGFVYAANEPARAGGIREGMPLAEAKARWEAFPFASPVRLSSPLKGNTSRGNPLQGNRLAGGVGHPRRLRPRVPHASSSEPVSMHR